MKSARSVNDPDNNLDSGEGRGGPWQHTNAHHIELETSFQQLPLNLRSDTVETNMAARKDGRGGNRRGSSRSHREES